MNTSHTGTSVRPHLTRYGTLSSPFWFVAEGAVIAAIMGYRAARLGEEGRETVEGKYGASTV